MSLVSAELRRLFKRRVTRWMLLLVVAILGAVVVGVAWTNQKIGPDALAAAEARAEANYQEQLRWHHENIDAEIDRCEAEQAAGTQGQEGVAGPADFNCEDMRQWEPQREDFQAAWYLPPSFHFREQFQDMILAFAGIMAMFAFIVGASYVGAEWRSGGMMNLLLWRPRRLQVLGAKLGTTTGTLLVLGAGLGLLWTAAFWLVAVNRGITDTMTAGAWESFALTGVRGLTLVLAAGAIGFALASIGRHTAMALGAAVAAVVVGLLGVLIVVGTFGMRYPEAWLWVTYPRAWLEGSVVLTDWDSCNFSFGRCEPATLEITWQTGGLVVGGATLLLLAVAMWQMRQRDVT